MTKLSAARAARDGPQIDLTAWADWLHKALDPAWRPGEWDPQRLLFAGDPDNPWTAVTRCPTRACGRTVHVNAFCTRCSKAFAQSEISREDFIATFSTDPDRRTRIRTADCLVAAGDVRCARDAKCRGLCANHYSSWAQREGTQPQCSFDEWLTDAKPYGPATACVVRGCEQDAPLTAVLCVMHRRHWRCHALAAGKALDDAACIRFWAETVALPYLSVEHFSLNATRHLVRLEVLYVLQERDRHDHKIFPGLVRRFLRLVADTEYLATNAAAWTHLLDRAAGTMGLDVLVREAHRILDGAVDQFRGIDPTDRLVWDLTAVGIYSVRSANGRRRRSGSLDFGQITQPWLRDLVMQWARDTKPVSEYLRSRFLACVIASQALALRPGGGMDLAGLGFADINAVIDGIRQMRNLRNGELAAAKRRRDIVGAFFMLLDYGLAAGLLLGLPASFARHRSHRICVEDASEDDLGKAIPESVIGQLDDHLACLGAEIPYGDYAREDIRALFQTVYIVHRDTGRRPRETCELGLDCLEYIDGEYTLLWDNRKGKRLRRRLPIPISTAEAILEWRERRARLALPPRSANYLFPAADETFGEGTHLPTHKFSEAIRLWADSIPELHSEETGPHGRPMPFDRRAIFPYAFRFSYAQRHADAGVRVEVLKDLMDHKSIDTTMGYFKVSLNRKRQAVNTIRAHVIDRNGHRAPIGSATAYQAKSVTVPFGNCHEPSNVKAGGKACPIRFQCAGCGFYRPDPSYLPAVEDHVRALKTDREIAQAMDADEFVVRNLTDQIAAFQRVVEVIREHLDQLPTDERHAVEEASAVLRRVRAADGIPSPTERRLSLPLTVIEPGQTR
ncbi:tyrosine-type recombinase/integrase [Nocardia sp. NBC_00881]|uniref:tyrosine-type recombinase/integrase n=1 Tax=Nocardia sp. NBC_00881 TaxID=2975995 RepID=UPI00386729BB|nr:tyrosine-type recombinase/integrase [Nocardia sp. NBC_00881]